LILLQEAVVEVVEGGEEMGTAEEGEEGTAMGPPTTTTTTINSLVEDSGDNREGVVGTAGGIITTEEATKEGVGVEGTRTMEVGQGVGVVEVGVVVVEEEAMMEVQVGVDHGGTVITEVSRI